MSLTSQKNLYSINWLLQLVICFFFNLVMWQLKISHAKNSLIVVTHNKRKELENWPEEINKTTSNSEILYIFTKYQ